jgi:hypothetical protein
MKREVEEKIIRTIIEHALKDGHRLSVSYERGYDLPGDHNEGTIYNSDNAEEIFAACFACDDCMLFIHRKGEEAMIDDRVNALGWIYFVLGNDGWDVISDYTSKLEKWRGMIAANAIADHYSK